MERPIDRAFVSGYRFLMLGAAALASALSAAILIEGRKPEAWPERSGSGEEAGEEALVGLKS